MKARSLSRYKHESALVTHRVDGVAIGLFGSVTTLADKSMDASGVICWTRQRRFGSLGGKKCSQGYRYGDIFLGD